MRALSSPRVERIHCNKCLGKTNHSLVHEIQGNRGSESDGDFTFEWNTSYAVLQCDGCQEVVLRRTYGDSEIEYPVVSYFPPPTSRPPPTWLYNLPGKLSMLLREIYRSLDAGNTWLSMMGARTLVDLVLVEKLGDEGSFEAKLKKLEEQHLISAPGRVVLDAALDAGNAAAHRGYAAKPTQVNAVMDIVENLLQAVYVLPDMAEDLKNSTPARPSRKKT